MNNIPVQHLDSAITDLDGRFGVGRKRAVSEIAKSIAHHLERANANGDTAIAKTLNHMVFKLEAKANQDSAMDTARIGQMMSSQSALPSGAMDRAADAWQPRYAGEQPRMKNNHAPLFEGVSDIALKSLFEAVDSGQSGFKVQTKAPSDLTGQVSPYQLPGVLQLLPHENRLLDRIPSAPTPVPIVQYLEHASTTGTAGTVAAGAAKPEIELVTVVKQATVSKIAAWTSTVTESFRDFASWRTYLPAELERQLIDQENYQLIQGGGTGTDILGLLNVTGITSVAYSPDSTTNLPTLPDIFGSTIAKMRAGTALARVDLIVMHPEDFWQLKLSHSTLNTYLSQADTLSAPTDSIWGIDVIQTTAMPQGTALLLDTTKFGTVFVRDPMFLFYDGYSAATSNILKVIAEERIALAVERPAAVGKITGIPALS